MVRDYQRSKVYAWEQKHVAPLDNSRIKADHVQATIDYIWSELSLEYPPKAMRLHANNSSAEAKANRMKIWTRDTISTWVLLHELAHSLTNTFDNKGDRHGPRFVGAYYELLTKFLPNADSMILLGSLQSERIDIDFKGSYFK